MILGGAAARRRGGAAAFPGAEAPGLRPTNKALRSTNPRLRSAKWWRRAAGSTAARRVAVTCLITLVLAGAAGCAGGRFVRPAGPTTPFPEGAAVWTSLTDACRKVTAVRAELRVSGRVHGSRVPSLTTGVGLDAGRISLVAMVGARRVFALAGDTASVIWLNQLEGTSTRGTAAAVTDALIGIPLEPARLLALLTGCVSADPAVVSSERAGAFVRLRTADSVIYLREREGRWQLAAAEFRDVVVDYRHLEAGTPRDLDLRRGTDVSLRLRVIEFERNSQLPPAVFRLQVPGAFVEHPLDEVRRRGPFGGEF